MLDPFPLPSIPILSTLIQPLSSYLSLTTLPLHIHEVLFSFLLYHTINVYLSPFLSRLLFPHTYPTFNRRTRINWNVHVVSLVQSLLINFLAIWVIRNDEERSDMNWKGRVWGYTGAGALVQAFATGYFLWDLWISVVHVDIFGWGLLAHAVSALYVFVLGFRPFVNYYGPIFILYELSSPFLNIHWFCDKLDLTGSALQFYNGLILIATFFLSRLVWGSYQTMLVFSDVYRALYSPASPANVKAGLGDRKEAATEGSWGPRSEIMRFAPRDWELPLWLAVTYLSANVILTVLNFFWFGQMIRTVRKRFNPPLGTKGVGEKRGEDDGRESDQRRGKEGEQDRDVGETVRDVQIGRGVYADGRKTLEVDAVEIRSLRRRG